MEQAVKAEDISDDSIKIGDKKFSKKILNLKSKLN
jgi:hypothetical protein